MIWIKALKQALQLTAETNTRYFACSRAKLRSPAAGQPLTRYNSLELESSVFVEDTAMLERPGPKTGGGLHQGVTKPCGNEGQGNIASAKQQNNIKGFAFLIHRFRHSTPITIIIVTSWVPAWTYTSQAKAGAVACMTAAQIGTQT